MRNIDPLLADEFKKPRTSPAIMAEMYFDTQTIGMWTGYGVLNWDDKQFLGGGTFVGLSPIEETQELQARGIVASLNGIPAANISLAQEENVRGRPFRLWIGVVSTTAYIAAEDDPGVLKAEDGAFLRLENSLIGTPYRQFSGLMDVMEYSTDGKSANVRLSIESNLIIGQRAKLSRYTNEDQRKKYPSDTGLRFINQLQDKEIIW